MKNKRIFCISGIYILFLFLIYQILLSITGFSINTPAYGLFAALIFFYYITEKFRFSLNNAKYDSIFINAIVFGIFFLFYKSLNIFLTFILFTIFQIFIYRIFVKISNKNELYNFQYLNLRSVIKFILDSSAIIIGMGISYIFKYENQWLLEIKNEYIYMYLGVFLIGYFYSHMNDKSWSYTNILDVLNLILLNIISSVSFLGVVYITKSKYSVLLLLVNLIITISIQLFFRYLFRLKRYYYNRNKNLMTKERAIIYGAGEAGVVLAKESLTNNKFPYEIVGFIDDDPKKLNVYIYNIKVLGNRDIIKDIVLKRKIKEVIIALPSLSSMELRKIVDEIKEIKNIKVKMLPSVANLVSDTELSNQIREVKVEDLLGRDEIHINDGNIKNLIENKIVFVTGGAGSIGSELSRQIARYSPKLLVNIDINENSIYFLELEMKRRHPNLNLISEICSIRDKQKLELLFKKYEPNIVFHAAAHKHVPLMEHNPEEAIKNNIFGTKNVAECADKYKVDKMVLISTDKAVNPTNIMGATKRACELVIQDMSKKATHTKYMAVRFGNVLGSNGSVIPLFRKLIEEGKNLTITHKDITRYFMTIPEAAQLVIEAGSLGKGREIFILDMGKPVRIYELAETMIKLSNSDVGIDIIGLRPGEKLYEELLYDVNSAVKTENKKIFITKIEDGEVNITEFYDRLKVCMEKANVDEIKSVMKELVVSYKEVKYN